MESFFFLMTRIWHVTDGRSSAWGNGSYAIVCYFLFVFHVLETTSDDHSGLDHHSESVLTDIDFPQDPLDTNLFPGIGSNILVHGGFADAQAEYVSFYPDG
jgi:hypothetical protein